MKRLFAIIVSAMCACANTHADDQLPSASVIAPIELGRVFMSPAERRELDRLRNGRTKLESGQVKQAGDPSLVPDAVVKKRRPAGYIVPSSGAPYQWIDGNFQRTTQGNIESELLPGRVTVIRHNNAPVDPARATPSAEESGARPGSETVSDSETTPDESS